jgi:hypothetical protein
MIPLVERDEALLLLEGRGMILDIAREVSVLMRAAGIDGAVIGGVAVVLHGYVRTTLDVDVFVPDPPERLADVLKSAGYVFDVSKKEFCKAGVPVHLVLLDQVRRAPAARVELEGVTTISLADLVDMKLRSGASNPLRAQDLADAIGLIRHHHLRSDFAEKLGSDVRGEFRRLVEAIDLG